MFFSNKRLSVQIPKDQHRQLRLLVEQLKSMDDELTIDALIATIIKDFLKEHFSNSNQKLLRKVNAKSR